MNRKLMNPTFDYIVLGSDFIYKLLGLGGVAKPSKN